MYAGTATLEITVNALAVNVPAIQFRGGPVDPDPHLYCDNFGTCNHFYLARGNPILTEAGARSKGWHIWMGTTEGQMAAKATLCPQCADGGRRGLPKPPKVMEGQMVLEIEVTFPPGT